MLEPLVQTDILEVCLYSPLTDLFSCVLSFPMINLSLICSSDSSNKLSKTLHNLLLSHFKQVQIIIFRKTIKLEKLEPSYFYKTIEEAILSCVDPCLSRNCVKRSMLYIPVFILGDIIHLRNSGLLQNGTKRKDWSNYWNHK